jgi:hypothetical protein
MWLVLVKRILTHNRVNWCRSFDEQEDAIEWAADMNRTIDRTGINRVMPLEGRYFVIHESEWKDFMTEE